MATSARKFYRTVIEVEVLSEEPFEYDTLYQVHCSITEGHCSGTVTPKVKNEEVDGPAMAKLLIAQRSDPEFFGLTDDGEDTLDYATDDELREGDPCPECKVALVSVVEEDGPHIQCPGCGLYWDSPCDNCTGDGCNVCFSADSTGEPEHGAPTSTEEA